MNIKVVGKSVKTKPNKNILTKKTKKVKQKTVYFLHSMVPNAVMFCHAMLAEGGGGTMSCYVGSH